MSKASIRWVIKFGGSLSQSACLADWLDALARRPCIIVPGGGLFADAVREAQNRHAFDDRVAHDLAIRAMGLYGRMLLGMAPKISRAESIAALTQRRDPESACLWLPDPEETCLQQLKASWDVTSDTIAATLALELEIPELVLVKSLTLAQEPLSLQSATDQGLVDPALRGMVQGRNLRLWLKGPDPEGLAKALEDPVSSLTQLIT